MEGNFLLQIIFIHILGDFVWAYTCLSKFFLLLFFSLATISQLSCNYLPTSKLKKPNSISFLYTTIILTLYDSYELPSYTYDGGLQTTIVSSDIIGYDGGS